jgi:hypothetical protein
MRAGRSFAPDIHALGASPMTFRVRLPVSHIGLAAGRALGRPARTHSPIRVARRRHGASRVRLDVIARRRRFCKPNQSAHRARRQVGPCTTGSIRCCWFTRIEPPLLRFFSPSAHTSRAALSGLAVLRTLPLRRSSPQFQWGRRPCGFSLTGAAAAMPAWRMTPRFARTFCPAPLRGRVLRDTPLWRHLRSPARVRHGETVLRTLARDPANASAVAATSFARSGSCADVILSTRRSATRTPGPSRPGRTSGPSLGSSGGAHGVQPFAGLLPQPGGSFISERPGPRACCTALARLD